MNEEQYLSRISQLENEIEYLHGLLDNAGISYKREEKDLDDLSPDRNLAFEADQGARILPVTITKQHIQYYYYLFKGRNDVYSKRSGKANKKTGKHGYYTQCWNFWKDGICPNWRKLKQRLKEEGNETVTNCHALKMTAQDGKKRLTDVANTEQLLRLIQSIPSKKAEPFKMWLAQVGRERIEEVIDLERMNM